jgi:biopolymer transport protein ExbD
VAPHTLSSPIESPDDEAAAPLMPPRSAAVDDEMDITPMIDMTFLLLIYFLLVATPDIRTSVDLPQATHGGAVSQRDATVITVGQGSGEQAPVYLADGEIASARLTGGPESHRDAIAQHVRKGLQESDRTNVVIKADRRVPHRDVSRVMRAVSLVEGVKLHLGVLEPLDD